MKPGRSGWVEALLMGVGALMVLWFLVLLDGPDPSLRGNQVASPLGSVLERGATALRSLSRQVCP